MRVIVRPRLQTEQFSLYWKEPLSTETQCLDDLVLDDVPSDATAQHVLDMTAQSLKWQPVTQLLRLDGFKDPWERLLCKGREVLPLDAPFAAALQGGSGDAGTDVTLVVVRKVLKADGWKIIQDGDFLSDDEDDDA